MASLGYHLAPHSTKPSYDLCEHQPFETHLNIFVLKSCVGVLRP